MILICMYRIGEKWESLLAERLVRKVLWQSRYEITSGPIWKLETQEASYEYQEEDQGRINSTW